MKSCNQQHSCAICFHQKLKLGDSNTHQGSQQQWSRVFPYHSPSGELKSLCSPGKPFERLHFQDLEALDSLETLTELSKPFLSSVFQQRTHRLHAKPLAINQDVERPPISAQDP